MFTLAKRSRQDDSAPMFGGSSRLVRGLTCLATCCAIASLAQEAPEPLDDEADQKPGTLLAESRGHELVPGNGEREREREREYIARPPAVDRPGACQPELQSLIRVTGTVYDGRHPERSMAMMGPASAPTAVYRTGSKFGHFELLEVRPHAVLLTTDREETPCWLKMQRPNPNAPPPAPPAEQPKESKESKRERNKAFSAEELQQGIQQLGPGIYRVNRTILDKAMERVPKLARTTRTKTVKKHGVATGMSLSRIESGGLFEHLGMKKGDVLKTVNGFDMSSVDGMLSARTQLSSAPRLSLSLTRGGQPMTLEYRVQ